MVNPIASARLPAVEPFNKRNVFLAPKAFAANSELLPLDTGNSALSSWIIKNEDSQAFVIHNVSDAAATFKLPEGFAETAAFQTNQVKNNKDGTFTIPSLTTVVFIFQLLQ